jgi:tetratricopeptide (TPR) repeat protein
MKRKEPRSVNHSLAGIGGLFVFLTGLVTFLGCSSTPPASPPPESVQEADQYKNSATRFSSRQQWAAAARDWERAARQYGLLNQRSQQAIALHNLAQAQRHRQQYQQAADSLSHATRLNLALGNSTEWWRNQVLGLQLEAATGQTDVLDLHFKELVPRSDTEIQDTATKGAFLNEYGLHQLKKGETEAALTTFEVARAIFEKNGSLNGQATTLANLARVHEAQAALEEAHQAWMNSLQIFEETGHLPGIATALAGLGRTLLHSNQNLDLAEDYLKRAASNFQQLKMEEEYLQTTELLQELAELPSL